MRCLRHCDLQRPLGNNTPHHQHIQSTVHKKKEAGLGTAWFYRLEFQSIAWDMQKGGGREGHREGGRTKLFCKQMRGNLGESKPLPPLHVCRRRCGPRRSPELQGVRLNQMIIMPVFTLRPCTSLDHSGEKAPSLLSERHLHVSLLHSLSGRWHFQV